MNVSPSTPTPRSSVGRLNWLWGTLGAVLLAVAVGLAVYFLMDWQHRTTVDAAVKQQVEEQVAAQQQVPQGPPPTKVKVAQVQLQLAQQRVAVVGRLKEVRRAVIASEVEGKVIELLTPAGCEVIGGQTVIARVDSVWSVLAVEQATADLAGANATARQSKRELEHLEALAQRAAADPQAVDDARAKSEADAAHVLAFDAALHRAQETRKRVDIIAPFDGVVTAKLTEQGQWVEPGSAVVQVVSRGLIDAVIDLPEQYITQVPVGTKIELTIEPLGQTINGDVVAINPDGSNPARTYPVKIRIDDQDGLLKIGMSVTARVPIRQESEHLIVPRDAVQYAEQGPQVWMALVMPGSAPGSMPLAMPMDVQVLFGQGDVFAIIPKPKGPGMALSEGMDVVVEGAEQLWPSRPLIVVPADGPPVTEQASGSEPASEQTDKDAERG